MELWLVMYKCCVYMSYLHVMSNSHLWPLEQAWPGFDLDAAGDGRRDSLWRNALLWAKSQFWSTKETLFFRWQWVSKSIHPSVHLFSNICKHIGTSLLLKQFIAFKFFMDCLACNISINNQNSKYLIILFSFLKSFKSKLFSHSDVVTSKFSNLADFLFNVC